jgi:hypothetical protein
LNDNDTGPATSAASGGDDTAAAPTEDATELIETGAAPTPELAWSADTEDTETIGENRSRTLWLVPVVALLVAAIAVASALLFYMHRTPASSTRAPAAPPLDGTYRLDYDFAKETVNGALVPEPNTNNQLALPPPRVGAQLRRHHPVVESPWLIEPAPAALAQLVERRPCKANGESSSLSRGSIPVGAEG